MSAYQGNANSLLRACRTAISLAMIGSTVLNSYAEASQLKVDATGVTSEFDQHMRAAVPAVWHSPAPPRNFDEAWEPETGAVLSVGARKEFGVERVLWLTLSRWTLVYLRDQAVSAAIIAALERGVEYLAKGSSRGKVRSAICGTLKRVKDYVGANFTTQEQARAQILEKVGEVTQAFGCD